MEVIDLLALIRVMKTRRQGVHLYRYAGSRHYRILAFTKMALYYSTSKGYEVRELGHSDYLMTFHKCATIFQFQKLRQSNFNKY